MKKAISVLLMFITIISSVSCVGTVALANDSPELSLIDTNHKLTYLSMSYTIPDDDSFCFVVEKSKDGINWKSEIRTQNTVDDSYTLYLRSATYFRYRLRWTNNYTGNYDYSDYSNTVKTYPNLYFIYFEASVTEQDSNRIKTELSLPEEYKKYIDGFLLYKSINGSAYKLSKTISVNSITNKVKKTYKYSLSEKTPNKYAYRILYKFVPFINDADKKYFNLKSNQKCVVDYVGSDIVMAIPHKNSVELRIKDVGNDAKFIISYAKYNAYHDDERKSKIKKITTSKRKLTIKNVDYSKYQCCGRIRVVWGNTKTADFTYFSSYNAENLMRQNNKKLKSKTYYIVNARGKKTHIKKNVKLTKKEKKAIKKFLNK